MSTAMLNKQETSTSAKQYATFYVDRLLLGIDICQVQEITRELDVTVVPHSPAHVRGVINLRGDVATVIDLRQVLGLPPAKVTRDSRNMIVQSQKESIGLLVDRISDILTIREDEIGPAPVNLDGVEGRFFQGVHTMERDLLILLDIEAVLADETNGR